MNAKTNRERADAAQAAAPAATLPNVRELEQRSADAYAKLAVRDEISAAKLMAREVGSDATDTADQSDA